MRSSTKTRINNAEINTIRSRMGRMGRSQAARDSPPASTRGTTPGYSERIHKENRIKKFCCSVCYLPNWIYPATRNLSYSSEIDLVLPNA